MKVLYYDCFSGISGDMNLGALLDLGVDENYLRMELEKLNISSEFELQVSKGMKMGISGTKAKVILKSDHEDTHDHSHGHSHDHGHGHSHGHDHHRNLRDIEEIIDGSTLTDRVKELSKDMFLRVAKAEAKVHGKGLYEVHFHEVGATDSLVDIIGAAICLDYLKVDKVLASNIELGSGFVNCAHGRIPVPAPATSEILTGVPVKIGGVDSEATTPTGAAILATNVEKYGSNMNFSIEKIGYGLGQKDFFIPNVLRVYLGREERNEKQDLGQYILETNIDDMNPEFYGYVEERLLKIGAKDVFKTPILMKKGRSAIKLSILVDEKKEKEVVTFLFKETTTIGMRKYPVDKIFMDRSYERVNTKYGAITIKKAFYEDEYIKYKAEYEECKKAAMKNNVPIRWIYEEVDKIIGEDR